MYVSYARQHLSCVPCVAVCCSVLQYVAVCCSMLQCVAVCCSVLQCVAVCRSVLHCVAVCCSVLQCVAYTRQHLSYVPCACKHVLVNLRVLGFTFIICEDVVSHKGCIYDAYHCHIHCRSLVRVYVHAYIHSCVHVFIYIIVYMHIYIHVCMYSYVLCVRLHLSYVIWVATISRLLKIIRLFCKRALWKRRYSYVSCVRLLRLVGSLKL